MYHSNYLDDATIFALSTAKGQSAIAIIRVSGIRAIEALNLFGISVPPTPRFLSLRKLRHPVHQEIIDHAAVLWLPGPANYTGEDMVEFHLHGGRAIVNEVLAALTSINGFRPAAPGEFTCRAFRNNRMDLVEAEAVQDLIEADTWRQRQQALRQLGGDISRFYEDFRERLVYILSMLEAYIDFPEEDIPEAIVGEMESEIKTLIHRCEALLDEGRSSVRLREGVRTVIIGPPNAGKSTLFNYLARKEIAITSEFAGTTRDALEVHLDVNGYPVTLIDTAGLREGVEPIEAIGIEKAKQIAEAADLKIVLMDASMFHVKQLEDMAYSGERLLVCNKIDIADTLPQGFMGISLKTEEGIESFFQALEDKLSTLCDTSRLAITNERHKACLLEVRNFLKSYFIEQELELKTETLRLAIKSLSRITSSIEVDEVLDNIFRKFCIGK